MSDPETTSREDPLMREAAGWFARMRGPDADSSREEFEAWLRRGALHRRAYNRAAEIFAMGKLLGEEDEPAPTRDHRQRRVAIAVVAAAALVALVLVFLITLPVISFDGASEQQLTGRDGLPGESAVLLADRDGEPRTFKLADGSTVMLEGGSSIEVKLGATERRLDLTLGRARFDVFHETRPFVVHVGGGTVTARGTRFEVALGEDRHVTVRLIEGIVDVALPPAKHHGTPPPEVKRLRAGMAVSFPATEVDHPVTGAGVTVLVPYAPSTDSARDFEAVSVAELVAQSNRTASRPIRLESDSIGRRRVSGRFRIDDSAVLAERLAALLDLTVDRDNPREIVLRPK